jgi:hypothetical protein
MMGRKHLEIEGPQWVRKNVYRCEGDLKETLQRIQADHLGRDWQGLSAHLPDGFLLISKKQIEENREFLREFFPEFEDYGC